MTPALSDRAAGACELCGAPEGLAALPVPPHAEVDAEHAVVGCATCRAQASGEQPMDATHWFCLQGAAWSEVTAVQVIAWQLLHRLDAGWAIELRDQIWLEDGARAWAEAGLAGDSAADEAPAAVVDSNGTPLANGDTVSLIRSLDVKGTRFVAKRGTSVRNIRLTDDPTHIQGKVNGVTIYLKTEYLKKLG